MFSPGLPKLPETVAAKITQDAAREALGRYVGGVGRNKSQFIATPCLEATALGCRRLWRIAALARTSLGPSIRNAAGGDSNGAKGNEAQASAANGPCTCSTGGHPPRGVPARPRRRARAAVTTPSPFQFVAPTPITGLGIDRNKVPAMVQTLPAEDFSRTYSPNVVETFVQRIPGVTTNNVQGNEFATDLRYRGFAASPVQGTPQGLAVYMQGIRVNEAFGDTVNWDLIPKVAIGRSDIWTNNPAFGLNALGGAISFQMKDGFTYNGTEFDTSGGSYGRVGGSLQYGVRNGEWGLYLAAEGLKDDGWRYQSPSRLARFYGDLGWKGTDAEIHLVTSAADNFFGVIGPTPVELLANDYRAIYTWPQTTKNQAELIALNGRYSVTDHWTVQSNLYYRRFDQAACRRQRRRGRALQRGCQQSAVQHTVPRKRCVSAAATAGGRLPDPQPERPADQLPAR